MITPEHVLTPGELDVLWHDLLPAPLPYPLDVPSLGDTEEERSRLRHETLARLDRSRRLEDLLRLLADHDVAVDAVSNVDRPVRALAASGGGRAVLAVIDGDQVGLAEIRPTALASSIVEVLPDGSAGPGNALSVRLETVREALALQENSPESEDPWGDDELDEQQALRKAGLSTQDAKMIGELAENRVAGGQFGVTWRGRSRLRAERAGVLINWFDTHQGRYLMVSENGWLSLSPADNGRIATRIESLLAAA